MKMALFKEESEDFRIEDVFSLKQEDTEELTDQMLLKKEVLNEMENDHYKNQHDSIPEEKNSASCSNTEETSLQNRHKIFHKDKLNTCQQCGKSFNQKGDLKRHITIHTEEKPYSCQQCGKRFNRKGNLKRHSGQHKGEKPYSCQQCGKSFHQKSHLNKHIGLHPDKKMLKEEVLNEMEGNDEYKNQHDSRTEEKFSCVCSNTEETFLQNGDKITGRKSCLTCQECGKKFNQKKKLKRHMKIHTDEKIYTCQQCGKSFDRKSELIIHIRDHTGEKPFICQQCGKGFKDKSNLKRHNKIHTREKFYTCQQCGRSFRRKGNLNKHLQMHTDLLKEEVPNEIEEYDEHKNQHVFKTEENTEDTFLHDRAKITGSKSYLTYQENYTNDVKQKSLKLLMINYTNNLFTCKQCGRSFQEMHDMQRHIIIHTGEKPYGCQKCGQRFNRKGNLDRHSRIHIGEKPYSCKECGKSFLRKAALNRHIFVHTGEKPLTCQHCGKGFYQKVDLENHIRIHTKEKPFGCQQCGKCFNQKGHLKRHSKQCGKVSTGKPPLTDTGIHTGEEPSQKAQDINGKDNVPHLSIKRRNKSSYNKVHV